MSKFASQIMFEDTLDKQVAAEGGQPVTEWVYSVVGKRDGEEITARIVLTQSQLNYIFNVK